MPQIEVINREGIARSIGTIAGASVMELVRDAGAEEEFGLCGGFCSCSTCHIYIDDAAAAHFDGPSEAEDALLDGSSYRQPNSRLACQLAGDAAPDGLKITIAPLG